MQCMSLTRHFFLALVTNGYVRLLLDELGLDIETRKHHRSNSRFCMSGKAPFFQNTSPPVMLGFMKIYPQNKVMSVDRYRSQN